jgi:hypothetical protein
VCSTLHAIGSLHGPSPPLVPGYFRVDEGKGTETQMQFPSGHRWDPPLYLSSWGGGGIAPLVLYNVTTQMGFHTSDA